MDKELGIHKGETCNRNGCQGIIEEGEKEGSCSCHISPPCSYCTTQTEYCPECGWSAEEDQRKHLDEYINRKSHSEWVYKSDEQRFCELKDGEFGYIHIASGAQSVVRLKGKHPGMSFDEIYKKLGLSENPNMPRMKRYTDDIFELTYFCG